VATKEKSFLSPEDVEDALSLIEIAIQLRDGEALRAVWNCWDEDQKRQLWAVIMDSRRDEMRLIFSETEVSTVLPSQEFFSDGA
jgi:hypothetical protein